MSKIFFAFVLIAACLFIANALPAGRSGEALYDADTIIEKIIAQYEKLGGTSQRYPEERAVYIDPDNVRLPF